MTHICVSKLGNHWFRQWLVASATQSYYLNQWSLIINWTNGNKLQWNLSQNTNIFIKRNASEYVHKMVAILFRTQCVNYRHQNTCIFIFSKINSPWQVLIIVIIGSGIGLSLDSTKPLPKSMLFPSSVMSSTFTWSHFHRKSSGYSSLKICWDITYFTTSPKGPMC